MLSVQSIVDFHPLRLYLIVSALLCALSFLVRRITDSRQTGTALLVALSVASAATALFFLCLEMLPYLTSPLSLWPLEPQILSVSALAARGEIIYPDPATDGAIYGQVYGPGVYLFYGWIFRLFGAGYAQAKLATATALVLAFACGIRIAHSTDDRRLAIGMVGALFAWTAYWGAYVYGTRPESILLLGVGLASLSVVLKKQRLSLLALGFGTTIAISVKPSAALYVAPIFVLTLARAGAVRTLSVGLISTGAAFLPFLCQQADFTTFRVLLENVQANFPLRLRHLPSLAQTAAITSLPLAVLCSTAILRKGPAFAPRATRRRHPIWWAAVLAFAACQVAVGWISLHLLAASHHWAPFIFPLIALAATSPILPNRSKPTDSSDPNPPAILIAWCALCLTLTLVITFASYRSGPRRDLRERASTSREIVKEIRRIASNFPGKTIHMDWGDGRVWDVGASSPAYRSALVFLGHPYLLEPSSIMEWEIGGTDVDALSAQIIANAGIDLWLVPKGQKPMRFLNSYTKTPALGKSTWKVFEQLYEPISEASYFDIHSLKAKNESK